MSEESAIQLWCEKLHHFQRFKSGEFEVAKRHDEHSGTCEYATSQLLFRVTKARG